MGGVRKTNSDLRVEWTVLPPALTLEDNEADILLGKSRKKDAGSEEQGEQVEKRHDESGGEMASWEKSDGKSNFTQNAFASLAKRLWK